jgi:hypothetical protein
METFDLIDFILPRIDQILRPKATAASNNNFQFIEYINEFLYDPTPLPSNDKVSQYIERLKSIGWDLANVIRFELSSQGHSQLTKV